MCMCVVVVVVLLLFLNDTCIYAYAFVECREARDFVRQQVRSHVKAEVRV